MSGLDAKWLFCCLGLVGLGVARLMLLLIMQSIRWKGEMFDIIMGALEREKDYANINTNPLEHPYTDYVDEDSSSWIHQIKKMDGKNNIRITIKDMKHTKNTE